jgi:hypothetical protein
MIKFKDYIDEGKRGLWDNIHAKQKRIKAGSGERMRKPGSKGAPTAAALKASQNEEVSLDEGIDPSEVAGNPKMYNADTAKKAYYHKNASASDKESLAKHLDRHHGNKEWRTPVKEELTAEEMFDLIEEMAVELAEETQLDLEQVWEELDEFSDNELLEACTCWTGYKRKTGTKPCEEGSCVKEESELDEGMKQNLRKYVPGYAKREIDKKMDAGKFGKDDVAKDANYYRYKNIQDKIKKEEVELDEAAVDAKGYKSSTGGLTQKGRDAYNRKEGSNLKAPVTTSPSKLKKGSKAANRRKSFCARMSGVEGPMKKPNGEPTRKALALRKWNC